MWSLVSGLVDVGICFNVDTPRTKGKMRLVYPHKSVLGRELEYEEGKSLDFTKWTVDNFLELLVMTGCDYVRSPHNVGFKKAYKLVVRGTYNYVVRGTWYVECVRFHLFSD